MRPVHRVIRHLVGMGLFVLFLSAGVARGDFAVVEDFEGLTLGGIGGQNGWAAPSSSVVAVDPAGGANQVLAVMGATTVAHKDMLLEQGQTRMVFLRFRFDDQLSGSFGLSHLSSPDEHSDFGPELNLTNASTDLRVANGAANDTLTTLATGTWYNLWVLVNNDSDDVQVWLNSAPGASATSADKLDNDLGESTFDFRTSSSLDLINFYIKTGSGGSGDFGPLYFDDIYVETADGVNLANPVPEPHAFGLVAAGLAMLALRLRRR